MEMAKVPEGVLTWEWEELPGAGTPDRQLTNIRLNGVPVLPGVERQGWVQAIHYRSRDD